MTTDPIQPDENDASGDPPSIDEVAAWSSEEARTVTARFDDVTWLALGDELERRAAAEPLVATGAARTLRAFALENDDPRHAPGRSRTLRACAQSLAYAGALDEALTAADEAEAIARSHDHAVPAARAAIAAMHPLVKLGRVDEALRRGETARQALLAANELDLAARADINIGNLHKVRGEADEALLSLDRALERLGSDRTMRGHIENTRGEALLLLDRFDDADRAFGQAANALRATSPFATAIVLGNAADLDARRGRPQRALDRFREAIDAIPAEAAPGHRARLRIELAELLVSLGAIDDAEGEAIDATRIARDAGLHAERGRGAATLAAIAFARGRHDEAVERFDDAIDAAERVGDARLAFRRRVDRAAVEIDANRLEQARRSLSDTNDDPDPTSLDSLVREVRRADLALSEGRAEATEEIARLAFAHPLARTLGAIESDLEWSRSRALDALGRRAEAVDAARRSVEAAERLRGSIGRERLRATLLSSLVDRYEHLVGLLVGSGTASADEIFEALELARARSLFEELRRTVDPSEEDPAAAALRERLEALYRRLETGRGSDDPRRRLAPEAWRSEAETLERELERVRETSGRDSDPLRPVDLKTLRASLHADEVLVQYFEHDDVVAALVVDRDGARLTERLGSSADVEEALRAFHFQVRRALVRAGTADARIERGAEDADEALELLRARLVRPLALRASTRRIVVVPNALLASMPTGALFDPDLPAATARTVPSASVLAHLRASGNESPERLQPFVVIGVGDEAARSIELEASELAATHRADTLLVGDAATVDAVRPALAGAAIAHVACHGRFAATAPRTSGLRLADRWLGLREIRSWRARPDLLVLSGCETGVRTPDRAADGLGIARAFLASGARCVVASLWAVDDAITRAHMRAFHRALHVRTRDERCDDPIGAAMRDAVAETRERHPHPAHWAAFVVTGA